MRFEKTMELDLPIYTFYLDVKENDQDFIKKYLADRTVCDTKQYDE